MVFVILILAAVFCTYYVKRKYSYWERKNVPFIQPKFPFGNFPPKLNATILLKKYYDHYKNEHVRFCGAYMFMSPVVIAIDLDFIKNILVKDFQYFMNRGMYHNVEDDPLTGHLFNIEGQQWKELRSKLTPTFTSGKMKLMFNTIYEIANRFDQRISHDLKISCEIEVKDLFARFTTDVIAHCAFGIECDSLNEPNTKFREMGRMIFGAPLSSRFKMIFKIIFPQAAKMLHMISVRKEVSEFFISAVRNEVKHREKNNIQKNDFLDLMIEIKRANKRRDSLTIEQIAAHAFVFFVGGFETSATVMSYAVYEMCLNKEIQDRARKEIHDVIMKYNGQLSYDGLMEMKYIEFIVKESLRKYPPSPNLIRKVTKNYFDKESGVTLEKGTRIVIPSYSIQHDAMYYPKPDDYNPIRFENENCSYPFLSFGEGPRNCIGMRFGMMQSKIGLVTLLGNYRFTNSVKTKVPLSFKTPSVMLTSNGGLWLDLEKIRH